MSSPFGRVYKLFLERCCTQKFPGEAAENRRNALSQQLRQVGCETPEGWAVLLALFPFFPPDQLKVEDAAAKLPKWLTQSLRSSLRSIGTITSLQAIRTGSIRF